MAANANLLDQLMGSARNALPGERVKEKHWSDDGVSSILSSGRFSCFVFGHHHIIDSTVYRMVLELSYAQ